MRIAQFIAATSASLLLAPSTQAATLLSRSDLSTGWCGSGDCTKAGLGYEASNLPGVLPVAAAIPEPAVWALLILGFFAIAALLRRSRTVQTVA